MMRHAVFLSGTTNISLAKEVATLLSIPLFTVDRANFLDGETYIRIPDIQKKDIIIMQSGAPQPNDALIDLLFILDAVFRRRPRSVYVVLPFFPYRRQERQEHRGEAIGAAVVGRCLSSFPVKQFFCVQPHTPLLRSFFMKLYTPITTLSLFVSHFYFLRSNAQWVVLAPDEGSIALSYALARKLNLPFVLMQKKRKGHDEVASVRIRRGNIARKNVLIIDDEISTGGTIIANMKIARMYGARTIVVAATHPVFSGDAVRRLQRSSLDRVVVTNTIALPSEKLFSKLEQISVAPLIAEALLSEI